MNTRLGVILTVVLTMMLGVASAAPAQPPAASYSADMFQIEDLLARYEWALDFGDHKAYVETFAADGALAAGTSEVTGRDAIAKWLEDLGARTRAARPAGSVPSKIQHILSNLVVDLHGDTADAKSFWTEVWKPDGMNLTVRAAGFYEDKLVKRDGHWLFARRAIKPFPFNPPSPASGTPPAP